MSIEGKIQQITSAIESGRYEKAFSSFHAHFKGHKGIGKYADLASRFNAMEKSFADGAMKLQDFLVEQNILVKDLLSALSIISNKFKYKATRKRIRIEFTLNGKLANWSESMAKKIKAVLSAVLNISDSSISIVSISAGSIKVIIQLPQSAVTALLAGKHVNEIQEQLAKKGLELNRVRPVYEITKIPIGGANVGGDGWASIFKLKPLIMLCIAAIVGVLVYFIDPSCDSGLPPHVETPVESGREPVISHDDEVKKDLEVRFKIVDENNNLISDKSILRSIRWVATPKEKSHDFDNNPVKFIYAPNSKGTIKLIIDNDLFQLEETYRISQATYTIPLIKKIKEKEEISLEFYMSDRLFTKLNGTLLYQLGSSNSPKLSATIRNGKAVIKFDPKKHRTLYVKFGKDLEPKAIDLIDYKARINENTSTLKLRIESALK